MPFRKISDVSHDPFRDICCMDPEHDPPHHTMLLMQPGTWEYSCPRCGNRIEFVVEKPSF